MGVSHKKTLLKRRISSIFDNYQLIIVWASIKPIAKEIFNKNIEKSVTFTLKNTKSEINCLQPDFQQSNHLSLSDYLLSLKTTCKSSFDVDSVNNQNSGDYVQKFNLTTLESIPNLAYRQSKGPTPVKVTNVKFGKFPKNTLNLNFLNLGIPVVGSSIDYTALYTQDYGKLHVECPQPTSLFTLQIEKTKLNGVSLDTRVNLSISRCFSRALKTHEIAEIINVLTCEDNYENYRMQQLLGAFIQEPGKRINFIGSNELRQCALLNMNFLPLTAAKRNFTQITAGIQLVCLKHNRQLLYTILKTTLLLRYSSRVLKKLLCML